MERIDRHDASREHRPSGWLAVVGINRCRTCRRRWPCGPYLNVAMLRDVQRERAVIEWQRQLLVAQDEARRSAR